MKSILDGKTNNIYLENEKKLVRKTISESTTKTMRMALESVVARGGGKVTYIDGYRVGGKTGTAQKVKDGRYLENNYIMSFMAVLPSNDPKVVLYLAIDNNVFETAHLNDYKYYDILFKRTSKNLKKGIFSLSLLLSSIILESFLKQPLIYIMTIITAGLSIKNFCNFFSLFCKISFLDFIAEFFLTIFKANCFASISSNTNLLIKLFF